MNDTYDPVSETGEITFAGIGRLIKRSALRVVLYVLIGVLAASLIVLPIKMFVHTDPSVTARVEFVYSGIENGLDPFGTVFDKNQIKNNSVLTAAIAASGLESEIPVVADLREAIVITDVVSEEYQELKDLAASGNTEAQNQLLGYTYYPTRFDISVDYAALGLSRKETIGLLDNIIAAYRQYFTERYSNREAFTTQDFDLESDVEYVTYYIRYETYLLTINEYVESLTDIDSTYVASNGKSLAALRSMYTVLSEELNSFYRFILNDAVAKDKTTAAAEIGEIVQQLNDEKTAVDNEITSLKTQIENYKPNTTTSNPGNGLGSTIIMEYGDGYDELQRQLASANTRLSEIIRRQSRYGRLKTAFSDTGTPTDEALITEAEEKVTSLKSNCINYINTVNQTVTEYFAERYGANAVRTIQPPVYARGTMNVPLLYIYAAVVIVAIAAGLIVTHVKGKALEIRRRPKAAAQPANNADGDKDDAPPAP